MHDVFISYKSDDSALAMKVVKALEENGIPCWIAERDIRAGSNYAMDIPSAIREASFFVLILTEKAQASPWVLKEVDAAITQQKTILPLMVGSFPLSDAMNFLLTGVQYYDATRDLRGVIRQITAQIREKLPPAVPEEKTAPAAMAAAAPVSPGCGRQDAVKTKPPILKLLLRLICGAAGAFLGFCIAGAAAELLGLPLVNIGFAGIAGGVAGLVLGFLVPGFLKKKNEKKQ